MALTLYKLSEQIDLRLRGGKPDAVSPVDIRDIKLAVCQMGNTLIKATHFNETLPSGETVPDSCVTATYTLKVVEHKNVSKTTLPCMPVNLRRLQGIRSVGSTTDEYVQFIPMPGDEFLMVRQEPLISELLNQVGFKQESLDLVFNRDITSDDTPTKEVEVRLLTFDIDSYDDFAPLPLPADYESVIVEKVFEQFAGRTLPANPSTDLINDVKQ